MSRLRNQVRADVSTLAPEALKKSLLAAFDRSRLRNGPGVTCLELTCEDMVPVARELLAIVPGLLPHVQGIELPDLAVTWVISVGRFVRWPIRVRGGMFDNNAKDRNAKGNGWGKLMGALRGRAPFGASWIHKSFARNPDEWVRDKGKLKNGRWTNIKTRADGSHYKSTGRTHSRWYRRGKLYVPAETYRVRGTERLVRRFVDALYRIPVSSKIGKKLQAWRAAAGELSRKEHARSGLRTFWQAVAWSRAERDQFYQRKQRLPLRRTAAGVQSISLEPPPSEGLIEVQKDTGVAGGRAVRAELRPRVPRDGAKPRANNRRRSSEAIEGRSGKLRRQKRRQRPSAAPTAPETTPPSTEHIEKTLEALPDAPWRSPRPPRRTEPAATTSPALPVPELFRSTPPARRTAAPTTPATTPAPTELAFPSAPPSRRLHEPEIDPVPVVAPEVVALAHELGADTAELAGADLEALRDLEAERRWRKSGAERPSPTTDGADAVRDPKSSTTPQSE